MTLTQISLWLLVDEVSRQGSTDPDDIMDEMAYLVSRLKPPNYAFTLRPYRDGRAAEMCGKYVALDCEFMGVGPRGSRSALARFLIVNFHGYVIYDRYVRPNEPVTDYRTRVTGIRYPDLENAMEEDTAIQIIAGIIDGRTVIGHALFNDFRVLGLDMDDYDIEDTQKLGSLHMRLNTCKPSLKRAAAEVFGVTIQTGYHNSVIDARIAMLLWKLLVY